MVRIPERSSPANARALFASVLVEAEGTLRHTIALRLGELLLAVVHHLLERAWYRRREGVPRYIRHEGRCCRCGSTRSYRFSRNGFRTRHLIHHNGSGLCAALRTVHFAREQRCLFHKLRNIYNAIRLHQTLSPKQRRRRRGAIFKHFCAIWQAQHNATTLRHYLKVVRAYRDSQPLAVWTLRRDFRLTITYFELEQEFLTWDRKHLRIASRLERHNRNIRTQARAAKAYHSEIGVIAMASQEAHLFHVSQPHA